MKSKKIDLKTLGIVLSFMVLAVWLGTAVRQIVITEQQITQTQEELARTREELAQLRTDQEETLQEMRQGFEDQQSQLDSQAEQIRTQKNNLHNTNQAFTSFRKQRDQVEQEIREGLEMRRQRIEQQRAAARIRNSQRATYSGGGESVDGLASVGRFTLTAYEWTGNRCANGNYPTEGYTVASNYFPAGTRLYIEGIGERVVEDTGGMANSVIDVYLGDPGACVQFGRQSAEVYVIED